MRLLILAMIFSCPVQAQLFNGLLADNKTESLKNGDTIEIEGQVTYPYFKFSRTFKMKVTSGPHKDKNVDIEGAPENIISVNKGDTLKLLGKVGTVYGKNHFILKFLEWSPTSSQHIANLESKLKGQEKDRIDKEKASESTIERKNKEIALSLRVKEPSNYKKCQPKREKLTTIARNLEDSNSKYNRTGNNLYLKRSNSIASELQKAQVEFVDGDCEKFYYKKN